ncbi:MAG: ABC transporter ATP-binding protein [Clostridiales bacterium]|nr:ABC transporter ATP-binding protein [Clostridiales bacterium]
MRRWKLIGAFMRGNSMRYLGAVCAVVLTVTIGFVTPRVLGGTVDAILDKVRGQDNPLTFFGVMNDFLYARGGRDYLLSRLWLPAIALIALNLFNGVCQYMRGRWTAEASESIAKNMRDRLYKHLQVLPYDYHVKAQTGDLIQRCTSDVETIRRFLASQVVEIFRAILMIIVALTIMLGIHVKMTLYSMMLVPPLFLFAMFFFKWVRKAFTLSDEAEGRMSAVLQENLTGVRVVRAFGRQKFEVDKFNEANDDLLKKSRKLCDLLAVYWSGSDLMSMTQTGITLVMGVFIVAAGHGELTVGEMTVFTSYISMLLWPIRQLGRILSDMGKALVSFNRIDEILAQKPEEDSPEAVCPPIDREIAFKNVHFAYEEANPVLRGVNFTVQPGQTVAILGATGSGKSTLMHLLQRLYDVQDGEITIGGVDIRKIQKNHLRSRVGLILQEPFLYSRTVKDNIAISATDAADEDIYAAARTACADGFIRDFENGYATMVGERGVTLSGGQKQRVAIARTLLRENDILIFDDSLSAVDTQTDKAIREALHQQKAEGKKGATTFIISHRLTTLSEADFIVVLDGGEIVQQGTHTELIHEEGLYRRIYQIQSALEEELGRDTEDEEA